MGCARPALRRAGLPCIVTAKRSPFLQILQTFPKKIGKVNVKRGKLNGKTKVPKTRNLAHGGTYRKGRRRGGSAEKSGAAQRVRQSWRRLKDSYPAKLTLTRNLAKVQIKGRRRSPSQKSDKAVIDIKKKLTLIRILIRVRQVRIALLKCRKGCANLGTG